MRPITLSMSAFGPFATEQTIDFNALGRNPLFLINGPTGSGKTTILDAICFALYGKTTGDEREGTQMRCDLASDDRLTEVSFTFELGERRYQIRRVPEQLRAKKSGDGFTTQKSEAQLSRIEPDGSEVLLVAAKVSEATAQIEALTGLDVDQFRQVMVLPQGKFRELLMADSKAREKIFSQLFQTHIYRRIEERLKFQAAGIKKEVEANRNRRDGILQGSELVSDQALSDELAELAPALTLATEQKNKVDQEVLAISARLEQAYQLQQEFDALAQLKARADELTQQQPEITAQQTKLKGAQEAKGLQASYQALQSREREQLEAQQHQQKASSAQAQSQQGLKTVQAEMANLPELETQRQQALSSVQQYQAILPQLTQLEAMRAELSTKQQQLEEAQHQGLALKAKLGELEQQKTQAKANLPELEQQSQQLLTLQQAIHTQTQQREWFIEWQAAQDEGVKLTAQLDEAKARGSQLSEKHQALEQQNKRLTLRWHQGQAVLLAAELKQGEACPVCGSLEHPHLAQSPEAIPTEQEREALQAEEAQALALLHQARSDYRLLQQSLSGIEQRQMALVQKLGAVEALSLQALDDALAQARQAFDKATLAQQQVIKLEKQLDKWQQEEQQLNQRLEADRESYREREKQISVLSGQIAQLAESIPAELNTLEALESLLTQTQQKAGQLQAQIDSLREKLAKAEQESAAAKAQLQSALEHLERTQKQLQGAIHEFEQQLRQSNFASVQLFIQASLAEPQMAELERAIKAYEQAAISVQANIRQIEERIKDAKMPEIASLTEQKSQLQAEQAKRLESWQQLNGRLRQLQQTQQQLKDLDSKAGELESQYAVVGTLADVANGNTGNKISLQRFVLSVLLDDVLLEASHRLQLMSKGRYRLLRKEDRAKGNKASGLELEVEDAYTAKVRSVATLSGGESFMAALAMALGLSDVVQAYAGGIKLDTLFIDEGFGSLDQDSLELAIRTLVDLQSSGRMVGVISHVSEMKEQIPSRIDIIKMAAGSKIELILG
ncbi:SMC family ATPase [Shewanella sp. AS1]|uniref:AAA family ATPase n=1 Tax=Shewanella sp. AS1 TaxID=2907626 RepID=UPI001F2C5DF1|nr:SMC family ATPase [Shewanella sp. AS1]MCE9678287.1 SMC family ATPase [Shewanella sp. AS1]